MKNSRYKKGTIEKYLSREGCEEWLCKQLARASKILIAIFVAALVGWYGTKAGYAIWEAIHTGVAL